MGWKYICSVLNSGFVSTLAVATQSTFQFYHCSFHLTSSICLTPVRLWPLYMLYHYNVCWHSLWYSFKVTLMCKLGAKLTKYCKNPLVQLIMSQCGLFKELKKKVWWMWMWILLKMLQSSAQFSKGYDLNEADIDYVCPRELGIEWGSQQVGCL